MIFTHHKVKSFLGRYYLTQKDNYKIEFKHRRKLLGGTTAKCRGDEQIKEVYLILPKRPSEETLLRVAHAWKMNRSLKATLELLRGKTRINVKELLPNFVGQQDGTIASNFGPNCWNTTLNFHNPQHGIRMTEQYEIKAKLRDHYTEIKEGDLRPGDVIAFWQGGDLGHTAIYISKKIVWHKGGCCTSFPYTFETYHSAQAPYCNYYANSTITFHRPTRSWFKGKCSTNNNRRAA